MKIQESTFIKDKIFRKRIILLVLALMLLIIGSIAQYNFKPANWMTYRDFDVPGERNFINYLNPGVKDVSSNMKYQFDQTHWPVLLIVLFFFFPFMLLLRVLKDMDIKLRIHRYITQWATFVIARLGIFRVTGACPVKRSGLGIFPFMNCQSCELATGACPLGTFQMSLLNRQVPLIVVGKIILIGVISGRLVCGWICPFGFLLDIFDKIPGKRIVLSLKLVWFKYVFLGIFLISAGIYFFKNTADWLFYCSFLCPVGFWYGVLEYALTTGLKSLVEEFPHFQFMLYYHFFIGFSILAGSIKLGGRFFCKYFCPLGTFYGLFNKIAMFRIDTNSNKCQGCKKCIDVCPMRISILDKSHISRSSCILCGRCKKVCPSEKIEYKVGLFGIEKGLSDNKIITGEAKKGLDAMMGIK